MTGPLPAARREALPQGSPPASGRGASRIRVNRVFHLLCILKYFAKERLAE